MKQFSIITEQDDKGYFVRCPELQGCYTHGKTYEEAIENIRDAIRLHVLDRRARNERIPLKNVSVSVCYPHHVDCFI